MEQHARAKREHPDAIVFFRLGDFYEMFGEDAILCSRLLNLTLTSREKGKPNEVPMAGVPHHAAHAYIGRLLALGHRIALCEQMADPKLCKGIVPREVVRVLTPGLITHDEHLVAAQNNWLATLHVGRERVGIALLDISTGELRSAALADVAAALAELSHAAPREVLCGAEAGACSEAELLSDVQRVLATRAVHLDAPIDAEQLATTLEALQTDAQSLDPQQKYAVARALRFAAACTPGVELPVRAIARFSPSDSLVIDPNAQRHLELLESNSGDPKATLLSAINFTESPMGGRLLRQRLLSPLLDPREIGRRLDAVELWVSESVARSKLRTALSELGDLERLIARVILGETSPKDLGAIRDGLGAAASALAIVAKLSANAKKILEFEPEPEALAVLGQRLKDALVERPPAANKEGAVFRSGFDPELTELDQLKRNGSELIVALEARLREATNITSLKARYTRVFGWYLEVSKSALSKVPKSWRRKQTVAGGERFTLDELDELAERIASAEESHRARERALLKELTQAVAEQAASITHVARRLAEWDVAQSFAELAQRHDYVRPAIDSSGKLVILEGRHPVVERLGANPSAGGGFVPNDVQLDLEQGRLWVITGPNMAGKSTFLRQVALISILAQVGSYVPAKQAEIGVVDRVLSRVGASDNLAQGQSTFMVEMQETAEILRAATPRSLVILDEIGRGTSTFDGLAIAWAVAEHLDQVCRCRALFATHYHELTALADQSQHIENHSVSAREQGGDVVFLHRLIAGPASQSYGVAVAKLAGLPESVLGRARTLLSAFEGKDSGSTVAPHKPRRVGNVNQLSLFGSAPTAVAPPVRSPGESEVLHSLRNSDPNRLSPLEALQLLISLRSKL
ncbi:MAG TPA: DNA mismatch repair protein MutS [Polyangiaceae bacterium]|nr:DNA mismatch repair protein MutS [Polyangiaceae bacterium]